MEQIIINGTVVRAGQIWLDNCGEPEPIRKVSPGDFNYPITASNETYSHRGWTIKGFDGDLDCPHLVRCIYDPNEPQQPAAKQQRKVVQISNAEHDIAALCDDGTIWTLGAEAWRKLPPIPQDEHENQQEDSQ